MVEFSIVIPVYNEEKRIPKNIDAIFSFFKETGKNVEIIFVNDGSKDGTAKVLEDYKKQYQFSVISYPMNRGKGYAVRQGALAAKGGWIVFFDIDLATPLNEFHQLSASLTGSDAVIIGSRRLAESEIKKSESKIRTFLGHGFTKLSNILVPGVKDFTCGFKCFSAAARDIIFPRARIDRWGFDTELLYIAQLHKLPIRQIPVKWSHDENSKVKVVRAIMTTLRELASMKFYQLRGFYR